MLAGLVILLPSVGLLLLAQIAASVAALLIGTAATGGAALALAYRGSLQVINDIAPDDRRAELVASYLIVCFVGNSLPVVGVAHYRDGQGRPPRIACSRR